MYHVLSLRRSFSHFLSLITPSHLCRRVVHAVAPQILQFSFGDDPLNSGEMLSVSCTIVKGDFPVKLMWTFDDIPIDSSRPDINIVTNKRVSFLSIDSVAARHAGRYKCTATNAAGSDSHIAILSVNGTALVFVKRNLLPYTCIYIQFRYSFVTSCISAVIYRLSNHRSSRSLSSSR